MERVYKKKLFPSVRLKTRDKPDNSGGPPIMMDEVEQTTKNCENYKSNGTRPNTGSDFENTSGKAKYSLLNRFNKIYDRGHIPPNDWMKSAFLMLPIQRNSEEF